MRWRSAAQRQKLEEKAKQEAEVARSKQRVLRRLQYKEYLASQVWRDKRNAKLVEVGHRCEFETEGGRPDKPIYTRCEATDFLHAHHLTYDRFGGQEVSEDLQILCAFHHGVVELMKRNCLRCREPVFNYAEDAEQHWELYWERERESHQGDCFVVENFDDWGLALDSAIDNSPVFCDYCDHMMNKDD